MHRVEGVVECTATAGHGVAEQASDLGAAVETERH